jgi:hypothetical protein
MLLIESLDRFKKDEAFTGHGKLGMALVLTRKAKSLDFPIESRSLLTAGQGQVSGLSGKAINKILRDYGVSRSVGTESGRTSRGTVGAAAAYVQFLNQSYAERQLDLEVVERWWVDRIVDYFNSKPFVLDRDPSRTLRAILEDLLEQAVKRQKESPGTTYIGAVLQHLVGAKLSLALPQVAIEHHGFSVADTVSGRSGDFVIDDTAIHCTTAPTEALLLKCQVNIQAGLRPLVLTVGRGVEAAEVLAENKGIAGRVEIIDAVQFLATNLYEFSCFNDSQRRVTMEKLAARYNEIVNAEESDPSLRIAVS